MRRTERAEAVVFAAAEEGEPGRESAPSAGVVLLADVGGLDARITGAAGHLVTAGFTVAVPRIATPATEGAGEEAALDAVSDAALLGALTAALPLVPTPVYVVGIGLGGTTALVACALVPALRGAVSVHARLRVPTLTPNRPTQPLDLLPGVRWPVQVHVAGDDPLVHPRHVAELRERLGRRAIAHQVCVYPGLSRHFDDPSRPVHDRLAAATLWSRITRFLTHLRSAT